MNKTFSQARKAFPYLQLLLQLELLDEIDVELEMRQKQSYSSGVKGQLSVLSYGPSQETSTSCTKAGERL